MTIFSLNNTQEELTAAFCKAHVEMHGTGDHTLTKEMTAIHEAGHGVIYRLIGIAPFAEITQDHDGYWVGYCGQERGKRMVAKNVIEYMAADIITSMSGYTAEKELTSQYCLSSSGSDKAKAQTATLLLAKFNQLNPNYVFAACQTATDDLINEHSNAVIRLACKLEKEEYLSPDAVCETLRVTPRFSGHVELGTHILKYYVHPTTNNGG